MNIYILDSNMKKIKMINKYIFVQYTKFTRDIGTFELKMILNEDNAFLLDNKKNYYVLFDSEIFGKIYNVSKNDNNENEKVLSVKGELSNTIFKKRVINKTIEHVGLTYLLVIEIINDCFINVNDIKRKINMTIHADSGKLDKYCNVIKKQITGGYVWDEIKPILDQEMLNVDLKPKVVSTKLVDGKETNISGWEFKIFKGTDRTRNNVEGNTPIIFSQGLSNVQRTEYYSNTEEYCTNAYVAGEGEGNNRKWFEVLNKTNKDETDKSGWNRTELWIDARDIQSVQADGSTITSEQYEKLIKQRADEKFTEHKKNEVFEATLITNNNNYKLNVDYFVGDFVTVVDRDSNKEINAQVVGYTKSIIEDREIIDIIVAYGSDELNNDNLNIVQEYKKVQQKVDYIQNNIVFLEKEISNIVKNSIAEEIMFFGINYIPSNQRPYEFSGYGRGLKIGNGTPDVFKGGKEDTYYLLFDSNRSIFIGTQLNGAKDITWRKI